MVKARATFLLLAALALFTGIWTGLHRIGWSLSAGTASLHHGAIMVGGFLGTLISLEKVIPLHRKSAYLAPALSGASVIVGVLGWPQPALVLLVAASFSLSVVFLYYLSNQRDRIYMLMFVGSLCWLTGNLLLLTDHAYPASFPWWLGFGLFIITAERLELTKFLPVTSKANYALAALLVAYLIGVVLSFHGPGKWVSGLSLCGIALWLLRYDIVGISIRKEGLPKYMAIALLAGYIALMMTGVFFLYIGNHPMAYDAVVHTFFLGFIFSMIFAHGPVILPGVLGVSVKPYHRILYFWLALLHCSWILRVIGDLVMDFSLRRSSGVASAGAMLAYFATLLFLTRRNLISHAQVR